MDADFVHPFNNLGVTCTVHTLIKNDDTLFLVILIQLKGIVSLLLYSIFYNTGTHN